MFKLEDKREKQGTRKLNQIQIGEVAEYNGKLFMCIRDTSYYEDNRCLLNLSTLDIESLEDIDEIETIPLKLVSANMVVTEL